MIPAFNEHGNLAVGNYIADGSQCLVRCTLQEVHDRFVSSVSHDRKRLEIWNGWMRYREALEAFGLQYRMWVDGSFTTTKYGPGDIDIGIMLDGPTVDRLPAPQRPGFARLLDESYAKGEYHCHPFPLFIYPFDSPYFHSTYAHLSYITRVFGNCKHTNTPKAILVVEEGGAL